MLNLGYEQVDSPVHSYGLGVKAALFGIMATLCLVYSDLVFLASIPAVCVVLSEIAGVRPRVQGMLRFLLVFSLIVFAVNIIANQNGARVLWGTSFRFYFWRLSFRVTVESISAASAMALRLIGIILSFLLFTLTTRPEIIMGRLTAIRGMEGMGLLLALAYRFMSTLVADGVEIRDSLATRGVSFDEGGRVERITSYASLGIPLLVNGLDRSMQLAEAMESRAFGSGRVWRPPPFLESALDVLAATHLLAVGGIFLWAWAIQGVGKSEVLANPNYAPLSVLLSLLLLAPFILRLLHDRT